MTEQEDWFIVSRTCPSEIRDFLINVFEIIEVRVKVGKENGIVFHVHTNEKNHSLPHIHAIYGEYNASIEIKSAKVLSSNLPQKQIRIAQEWVGNNQIKLLNAWKTYTISAISNTTMSRLDLQR